MCWYHQEVVTVEIGNGAVVPLLSMLLQSRWLVKMTMIVAVAEMATVMAEKAPYRLSYKNTATFVSV